MDWGSKAPLVLAVVALVISIKALADAKRSRAIAEKTPEARQPEAAETVKPGAKAGAASEAAAPDAVEGTKADAAKTGDAKARASTDGAESEAAEGPKPNVELDVRHVENDLYRLTNNGTGPAVNIVFDEDNLPAVFLLRSTGEVNLEQDETVDFLMAGSVDKPLTQELRARWDGQEDPVPLRVPVKA